MITTKVIESLYKTYSKRPESPDCLDIPILFDYSSHHGINIDMEGNGAALVINSIEEPSPFHRLPLKLIHGIIPFEKWVAVVLRSSIIFLDRNSPKVNIHIKTEEPSLADRFRGLFNK